MVLERVERLFSQLKAAIDRSSEGPLEQTMVGLSDRLHVLREIVKDTLDAASNFLHTPAATPGATAAATDAESKQAQLYEQLLKELTVQSPEALQAKENRAQAEAQAELSKRIDIASLEDIQVFDPGPLPDP